MSIAAWLHLIIILKTQISFQLIKSTNWAPFEWKSLLWAIHKHQEERLCLKEHYKIKQRDKTCEYVIPVQGTEG